MGKTFSSICGFPEEEITSVTRRKQPKSLTNHELVEINRKWT